MPKFKPGLFIILILIAIFLFILVLVFPDKNVKKKTEKTTAVFPTPTTVLLIPTAQIPQPAVSLPSPTSTGGLETIPPEVKASALQKQSLRRNVPVKEKGFQITFDYSTDLFTVTGNRKLFNEWLTLNYPLIPLNEFLFK